VHALYRDNSGTNIHVITASDWSKVDTYRLHTDILRNGSALHAAVSPHASAASCVWLSITLPVLSYVAVELPEDPFLYRDSDGNWHSLHHAYPWPDGVHAFSTDGWNVSMCCVQCAGLGAALLSIGN
jgi:hypothetical protein